jgi:hypothetical protein
MFIYLSFITNKVQKQIMKLNENLTVKVTLVIDN